MTNKEWLNLLEEAYQFPIRDNTKVDRWFKLKFYDGEEAFLLSKYSKEYAELHKEHILKITQLFTRFFFKKAETGETFCDPSKIKLKLGKTLEEHYSVSSGPFLNLAYTYWTFRIQLDEDHYRQPKENVPLFFQILWTVEMNIAGSFFPSAGRVSADNQRRILNEFAPEINVEDFISENPMIKSRNKKMYYLRWLLFLPGAFIASAIANAVTLFSLLNASIVFPFQIEKSASLIVSSGVSSFAAIYFGVKIAPKHKKRVFIFLCIFFSLFSFVFLFFYIREGNLLEVYKRVASLFGIVLIILFRNKLILYNNKKDIRLIKLRYIPITVGIVKVLIAIFIFLLFDNIFTRLIAVLLIIWSTISFKMGLKASNEELDRIINDPNIHPDDSIRIFRRHLFDEDQ